MPLQPFTTNKKLLVTKPPEMDKNTDRGFREVERFLNQPDRFVGTPGPPGPPGPGGLPAGGTAGQILMKNSSTNYDAVWSSGGPGTSALTGGPTVLLTNTIVYQLPLNNAVWDTGSYVNSAAGRLMLATPGSFIVDGTLRITNNGNTEKMISFFIVHYNVGGGINTQLELACHVPAIANYIDFAATAHVHSTVANDWVQFNVVPNTVGGGPFVQDDAQVNWCSISHL